MENYEYKEAILSGAPDSMRIVWWLIVCKRNKIPLPNEIVQKIASWITVTFRCSFCWEPEGAPHCFIRCEYCDRENIECTVKSKDENTCHVCEMKICYDCIVKCESCDNCICPDCIDDELYCCDCQ